MKTVLYTLLVFLHLAGFAAANDYKFTLINKTGFEIIDLYVSPASQNEWGDEILTVDTIPDKERMNVHVSRKERVENWDILVNNENGATFTYPSLKLSEVSTLILTVKGGQLMAIYN